MIHHTMYSTSRINNNIYEAKLLFLSRGAQVHTGTLLAQVVVCQKIKKVYVCMSFFNSK